MAKHKPGKSNIPKRAGSLLDSQSTPSMASEGVLSGQELAEMWGDPCSHGRKEKKNKLLRSTPPAPAKPKQDSRDGTGNAAPRPAYWILRDEDGGYFVQGRSRDDEWPHDRKAAYRFSSRRWVRNWLRVWRKANGRPLTVIRVTVSFKPTPAAKELQALAEAAVEFASHPGADSFSRAELTKAARAYAAALRPTPKPSGGKK